MPNSRDETEKRLESWLAASVTSRRFKHSLGVREAAAQLALHYRVDPAPLRIAALVHDSTREMPAPLAISLAKEMGLRLRKADLMAPVLLHGRLAAALVQKDFGITDERVLSAVRRHTAGHPQMSLPDKLFFLADHIEPGRSHPHVAGLRELAFRNVDQAMLVAIRRTEEYLSEIGGVIDPDTTRLKDELKRCFGSGAR